MKQISIRVSEDLLDKINQACGQVPRERWIRDAVEDKLAGARRPETIMPRDARVEVQSFDVSAARERQKRLNAQRGKQ